MQQRGFGVTWHNIRVTYDQRPRTLYFLNESIILEYFKDAYYIHSDANGIEEASKEDAYLYWISWGGAEWESEGEKGE
jgi:hypothetical protein